jgi:sodium-independent sulfate anion transporter 11
MIKSLKKHEHKIVLTRTMPEILLILSGIGCDLHIHSEGMDLETFIKGTAIKTDINII